MATVTNDDIPNLFENQHFEEKKKLPRWIRELLRNPLSISGTLVDYKNAADYEAFFKKDDALNKELAKELGMLKR